LLFAPAANNSVGKHAKVSTVLLAGERVEFREALDALGLTAPEAAAAFGLQPQTIRLMRMDPSAAGYRRPPEGWEKVLAKLARQRGGELAQLAERLDRA
jgi:hypothetical protein